MRGALVRTVLLLLIAAGTLWSDTPIMRLEEVRPGMKGVLKTVLEGAKPEEIPIEVIDVIRRVGPGRDVVIIRLQGERITKLGVARGMSGSPVYVDGRLVGALAFAWRFVREPIAGLTPIEDMMRVERKDAPAGKKPVEVVHTWRRGEMLPSHRFIDELLSPRPAFPFISPANMMALETPIAVKGFSRESTAVLSDQLRMFDVSVVQAGGAGAPGNVPQDVKLEPGGVLAVQVLRGDYEAAALGTVTEVAGNRVYGFGHPLFNNGCIEFPLATGMVHVTVPTDEMSFKLGSALKPVGTVWVDQSAGIVGELGPLPEMLKVTLDVRRQDLVGDARFNFEVAKDPRMMLTFMNAAVGGALAVSGKPDTEVKIVLRATIGVAGYAPVEIEQVYGGPQASVGALSDFVVPLGHILHNPFTRVNVTSVQIVTEVVPGDPRAAIRDVGTDKTDYRPGEEMDVAVTLMPFRENSVVRHYRIRVPEDAPEGRLALMVCDSQTDARMESREMPHRFRPDDVSGVLDFFRQRRPNTDLVFRLSSSSSGVAVKGQEMAELPDSVVSVLEKQTPTEISRFSKTLVRREPTEFVLVGVQQLQVQVVKD